MSKRLNLTNKRFGRLIAIKPVPNRGDRTMWLCKCDCGINSIHNTSDLNNGHVKSCGCLVKENLTNYRHGHAKFRNESRFYRIWTRMLRRCRNVNAKDFQRYGAMGITCCKRWYKFKNFLKDMYQSFIEFEKFRQKATIDRIDNSKGYSPKNCRWATMAEQCRNKKNNIWVIYKGNKLCLKDFAHVIGWDYLKTYRWYKKGTLQSFFKETFF